jgi:hypothetical protein
MDVAWLQLDTPIGALSTHFGPLAEFLMSVTQPRPTGNVMLHDSTVWLAQGDTDTLTVNDSNGSKISM